MQHIFANIAVVLLSALVCSCSKNSGNPTEPVNPEMWTQTSFPGIGEKIVTIESYLLTFVPSSGVFLSSNGGTSWTHADSDLAIANVVTLAARGTSLFAGTSYGVSLSTDYGTTWHSVDSGLTTGPNEFLYPPRISRLLVNEPNLFAGSIGSGVFHSTNNALASSDTSTFIGSDVGVFVSTNAGASWVDVSDGLPYRTILALAVYNRSLYVEIYDAHTNSHGVWRHSL